MQETTIKKSRCTGSQIIGVLKEVDAGLSIVKACLFVGIGRATFYRPERLAQSGFFRFIS